MSQRPTIGDVGRTVSALTPDGEVEFDGFSFDARAQGGSIDAGRSVRVIGFDPRVLIVREASPAEAAAAKRPVADPYQGLPFARAAQGIAGGLIFTALVVLGGLWAFTGGLAGLGYLVAVAGQVGILVLIARECHPTAFFWALVIPFFSWVFVFQRWDVAKWPFLLSLAGSLVYVLGAAAGS